jgi:hypothetical protein
MNPALDQAARSLAVVLTEENTALEAMDFARAGALLARKHAAAEALAAAWRAAAAHDVNEQDLRALGVLADENRKLLNRAMRVQRRVLDLVTRAARAAAAPSRYTAAGRPTKRQSSPRSLTTRL